ncbi:MAG TPA: hypothetical protein DCG49_10755 [Ruminococcus sp.]|nr:hypothetical protein [Ruminococcus sp.]
MSNGKLCAALCDLLYDKLSKSFSRHEKRCDLIFGTEQTTHIGINQREASQLRNNFKIPLKVSERYHNSEYDGLLGSKDPKIADIYRAKLCLSETEERVYMEKLAQLIHGSGIPDLQHVIGSDSPDFCKAYARAVCYSITEAETQQKHPDHLELNHEDIHCQTHRIFTNPHINYILIITQIGMLYTTDQKVREEVIRYLQAGKKLEVILNDSDTRELVGQHMRNADMHHQTTTQRVCEQWKDIAKQCPDADLYVSVVKPPILHQIIKTSHLEDKKESDVSLCVRVYAYKVSEKDKNLSFNVTPSDEHYEILIDEIRFLREISIENMLICPECST